MYADFASISYQNERHEKFMEHNYDNIISHGFPMVNEHVEICVICIFSHYFMLITYRII